MTFSNENISLTFLYLCIKNKLQQINNFQEKLRILNNHQVFSFSKTTDLKLKCGIRCE